jgi:hypothetical protein
MSDEELVKRLRSCAFTGVSNQQVVYVDKSALEQAAARIDALTAKLAKAVEALEDASQIIRQCTWTTMRVNGQYVDRREVVQSYRATLAEIEGSNDP